MQQNERISFALHKTSRCIKRYVDRRAQEVCDGGLTGTHGWAIGWLYDHRHEDVFQRDFEKACGVRRSTATSILQRMEQNGLVVREGVPTDARLKKITLTEKSLQLHRQVETAFDTLEETLRAALTEEELRCFFSVLNKIQKEVEADDPTAQSMHPGI